jgi:transcriptional regulator with XRE-family HTH domain
MDYTKKTITLFGEIIRSLRENKNMTLREVSNKIGIDPSLLGKIERNERKVTIAQIELIAKLFNCDKQELIEENLSDQLAYKIIEVEANKTVLKIVEKKINYLKNK